MTERITIIPYLGERGRLQVMVGNVRYGVVHIRQHGRKGTSYYFRQAGSQGGAVRREHRTGDRSYMVEIFGDKMAKRMAPVHAKVRPVQARLLTEACKLVKEGLLVSELVHRNRVVKINEEAAQRQRQAQLEVDEEFTKRANEAIKAALKRMPLVEMIDGYNADFSPEGRELLKAEIVEAMKWAQSK